VLVAISHRLQIVPEAAVGSKGIVGGSRGFGGATYSAGNRATGTEVARHRSGPLNPDAGSIPTCQVLRRPPQSRQVPVEGLHFYL
jgi:hypothetical protein